LTAAFARKGLFIPLYSELDDNLSTELFFYRLRYGERLDLGSLSLLRVNRKRTRLLIIFV
ncbi:hypothetical protein ACIRCE_003487, partial [Vibrio cholerae]